MGDLTRDDILEVLEQSAWFASLPSEHRSTLVDRGEIRRYEQGQLISSEGLPSEGLLAVLDGQIAVMRWVGPDESALLDVAERGAWHREYAALTGEPPLMSYVAHSDTAVLVVPQTVVDELIQGDPLVYVHLARLAIERYGRALRWILESQGLQPEMLLRKRLADLVEMRRADDPDAESEIRLPQQEIAALVGVSRQTANAILKRLEEDGLVRIGMRRIYVPDVAALRG